MTLAAELTSSGLLFTLVFCMSATVDINNLIAALSNRNAIISGLFLQFVVLPFLGFCVVKALDMPTAMGISLLVVTSSPGGSYSNWWCSMFNADLALSVTMTAISTLCSVVMLPLNLLLYTSTSFEANVVSNLDWGSLFMSIGVVISAIALGLFMSAYVKSYTFNLMANKLGNFAGIALVLFSVFVSSISGEEPIEEAAPPPESSTQGWKFYLGVATPCFLGLVLSNVLTTFAKLEEPERV
jgi:predicted Na+-dependent transporter